MEKLAFSLNEAMETTGLGRGALGRQIELGAIETRKVGGRVIIPAESLRAWLAALPLATDKSNMNVPAGEGVATFRSIGRRDVCGVPPGFSFPGGGAGAVRYLSAQVRNVDDDARTMDLTFSSETPVDQYFGREILSHDPGAADLSTLNNGAPLLWNHDGSDIRGVVESASIGTDKRGHATVRFSKSAKGEEAWQDAKDGILRGVSVGYRIKDMKQSGGTSANPDYLVTKWQPHEISLAPVPADHTIGVGRAATSSGYRSSVPATAIYHTMEDLNKMNASTRLTDIGFSNSDLKNYSLCRALVSANAPTNDPNYGSFEREVSQEIAQRTKKGTGGFFMPTDLPMGGERTTSATAYGATINATQGGSNLIATQLMASSFIDLLRNKTRIMQMGATMLPGMVGNVMIPRQSAASTAYWAAPEGTDIAESEGAFDSITLAPKTIGSRAQYSRTMMIQATPNIEMLVRNDLAEVLALGIDLAAIAGTGSNGQPLGILNTAGVTTIPLGTNGAISSIDNLIALETALMIANINSDNVAYLTNAKVVGGWKTLKDTTGRYLWTDNTRDGEWGQRGATPLPGMMNGYPVFRSNQVPANLSKGTSTGTLSAILMGNFADLLIAEWGVLEILPNPYGAGFNSGTIDVRALQSVDIKLRHNASFAIITDAVQ